VTEVNVATPFVLPRLSMTSHEATVLRWYKEAGASFAKGEALLQVELDKATLDVEAPMPGRLTRIIAGPKAVVRVGESLAEVESEAAPAPAGAVLTSSSDGAPTVAVQSRPRPETASGSAAQAISRRSSPAERRREREQAARSATPESLAPQNVQAGARPEPQPPASARAPEKPLEAASFQGEPLSGVQRVMLERMTAHLQTVAQATTVAEADMTEITQLRQSVPATFTAWVIWAASRALTEFPVLNASLCGEHVIYHADVNMGVSVETDAGLIVPVMHRANGLSLLQVHQALERLVQAARSRSLSPDEVAGATFTVTNSGVLGSVLYTPLIVPPQSAILGMGRVAKTPVVRNEQIAIRSMMYLCLSYDHRFIAGGTAVRYLQRVRQLLENPLTALWE
jgi:pyruvate/2-oxoglutarate dehydrogenase complex dihydrolipoamide acyltransferase (E2) component